MIATPKPEVGYIVLELVDSDSIQALTIFTAEQYEQALDHAVALVIKYMQDCNKVTATLKTIRQVFQEYGIWSNGAWFHEEVDGDDYNIYLLEGNLYHDR